MIQFGEFRNNLKSYLSCQTISPFSATANGQIAISHALICCITSLGQLTLPWGQIEPNNIRHYLVMGFIPFVVKQLEPLPVSELKNQSLHSVSQGQMGCAPPLVNLFLYFEKSGI